MSKFFKASRIILWLIIAIGVTLIVVRVFLVGYFRIPQDGMYPTLASGSVLFTARHAYSNPARVKRGDIVVFVREEDGQRYNYIWRVIGLPGDKIEASGDSLIINGQAVQRQLVREADGRKIFREQNGDATYEVAFDTTPSGDPPPNVSLVVPADQFFVMGDNRLDARDSRHFGPIPFSSIIGKKL